MKEFKIMGNVQTNIFYGSDYILIISRGKSKLSKRLDLIKSP